MAKKTKASSSGRIQANAPEYQQMLPSQPPHNPYYPDPAASLATPTSVPPPPYSITSVPISSTSSAARNSVPMTYSHDISYPRVQSGTSIIVEASGLPYDSRADRYKRKVRSFNSQALAIAILAVALSIWAYSLYDNRPCINGFVVHKVNKEVEIKISDVRNLHLTVAYASGFIILLCLLKSAIGFRDKSHSCYLFIIGLCSLIICIHTAYLAYLSFYSPCVVKFEEMAASAFKTLTSKFVDNLPTPDKGVFGEQNVFTEAKQDGYGVAIFLMDCMNVILYFSIFIGSMTC